MSIRVKFLLILVLAVVTAVLAYPREDAIFKLIGLKNVHLAVRQGLDLQGGAQLTYQADLSKTAAAQRTNAMNSLVSVMTRRANGTGTSEASVQQQGNNRVLVQLPGESNVSDAITQLGRTADLEFFVQTSPTAAPQPAGLSGKDVQSATADFDTQTGQPIVRLQLKGGQATTTLSNITTQISQTGGYLTITLDNQVLFGPATAQPIPNGQAQLSGNFTAQLAQSTATLINSGALPVPVTLVAQTTVGPSLGHESIARSLVAGLIGLLVVALFMIAYYRLAGLLAVGALFIYTAITLSLYKLSALVPGYAIVLTLAGIAGFILSIGMAVDANILIFERLKEELRAGKSFVAATETAFQRAWTSIRDSNTSTLITCLILYVSSAATPIIRGFAVTLALGVAVSLFTSVVITRTFLRLIIRTRIGRDPRWYGLPAEEEAV